MDTSETTVGARLLPGDRQQLPMQHPNLNRPASAFAMPPTQADQIFEYIRGGQWISPLEALAKFKCFRLASRISEIQKQLEGSKWYVAKRTRQLMGGKRCAEYTIALRDGA